MDSRPKPAATSAPKSKAHSRLASFSRVRLRGTVQTIDLPVQGETTPRVPVSPSDAGSQDKRSGASTRSNSSFETALTDDSKSDPKSVDDRTVRKEDAATWLDTEEDHDSYPDTEAYQQMLSKSPRMMHQTSSKLLRMTDEELPYSKVCLSCLFVSHE